MNPSFEERSVWVTLIATLLVLGGYFYVAAGLLAEGITEMAAYVPLFVVAVGLLVVVLIVGHLLAIIGGKPEDRDERDRQIAWRAEHNSSWLLAVGVLAAVFGLALPIEKVWIANGLLAALFVSEVMSKLLQLVYYRRGM